jgi:hypothetical protein
MDLGDRGLGSETSEADGLCFGAPWRIQNEQSTVGDHDEAWIGICPLEHAGDFFELAQNLPDWAFEIDCAAGGGASNEALVTFQQPRKSVTDPHPCFLSPLLGVWSRQDDKCNGRHSKPDQNRTPWVEVGGIVGPP